MRVACLQGSNGRGLIFGAGLILLFLASFALPIYFATRYSGSVVQSGAEEDAVFPDGTVIARGAGFLRIRNADTLQPSAGRDFVFSVWINPKRPPKEGQRMVIASKSGDKTPGYSLAIASDGTAVRPEVRWVGQEGKGKWFVFGELPLVIDRWHLFVVSFIDGRYLGLHAVTILGEAKPEVKLLGGYDVAEYGIPHNQLPLEVGAVDGGAFRGKVGAIGVFAGSKFGDRVKDLAKELSRSPREIPTILSDREVLLWSVDGVRDLSSSQLEITANAGLLKSREERTSSPGDVD